MDQRAAFEDTLALAEGRGMALMPESDLGLEHLREMAAAIRAGINPQDSEKPFSEGELGRHIAYRNDRMNQLQDMRDTLSSAGIGSDV